MVVTRDARPKAFLATIYTYYQSSDRSSSSRGADLRRAASRVEEGIVAITRGIHQSNRSDGSVFCSFELVDIKAWHSVNKVLLVVWSKEPLESQRIALVASSDRRCKSR